MTRAPRRGGANGGDDSGGDGGRSIRRRWRRTVGHPAFPLVAEGFLSRLSFGIISLALPLYAYRLGMSVAEIGVLLSLNMVVALLLKPLMGAVADKVGLKRSLVAAIAMRSVVSLLFVFAAAPWQLFAIRGLHGVSIAMRDPATYALVAEAGGKRQIASSFAWYQTAKTLAGSIGRGVAGVVLTLAGGFAPAFAVAFALSALPLVIVVTKVREPAGEPPLDAAAAVGPPPTPALGGTTGAGTTGAGTTGAGPTGAGPTGAGPTEPPARAAAGRIPIAPFATVGFLITGSAYLFTALFPVFATEYAGLSPAAVGAIYVLGSLLALTGPLWGWLADRLSFGMVLSLRSIANVASSIVYLVSPTLAGVAVGKALDDTGKAAFRPAWGAMMAHVASHDRRHRARIMAWLGVGEDAGEVAGPIVAGLVWTAWGIPAVLGIRIGTAVAAEAATAFVTHRYGSPTADRSAPTGRGRTRLAAPRSRRQRTQAANELALDFGAVLEQALATSVAASASASPAKGSTGAHRTTALRRPNAGHGGSRGRVPAEEETALELALLIEVALASASTEGAR